MPPPHRPTHLLSTQSGQTVTEFLMISGLLTASAIAVLTIFYGPAQEGLQAVTQCIIDGAINGVSCVPGAASPGGPVDVPPDPAPQPTPTPPPSPPPVYYPSSTCGFETGEGPGGVDGYSVVVSTGTSPGWPGVNGVRPESVTIEPATTCTSPTVIVGTWHAQVMGPITPTTPCQIVFTVCYPGRCVTARAQFNPAFPFSCQSSVQ